MGKSGEPSYWFFDLHHEPQNPVESGNFKLRHYLALYGVWYNFVRMHKTIRMTPAMAAGVSQTLWSMEDLLGLVERYEAAQAPKTRGPYKKRTHEISN
jgi:hypothetical protein